MSCTCVFATSKGGAGKTTTAIVVLGTAIEMGYSVGVIDGDRNQTLKAWLENFSDLDVECISVLDETEMVPAVQALEEKYDLVLVDTGGRKSQSNLFAIGCADVVLIPVQSSSADVIEAIKTKNLVKSAGELVQREIPAKVVLTDFTPNTNIARYIVEQCEENNLQVMDSRLHRLVAFKEMTFTGEIPNSGIAGAQAQFLFDEIKRMGVLPTQMREVS